MGFKIFDIINMVAQLIPLQFYPLSYFVAKRFMSKNISLHVLVHPLYPITTVGGGCHQRVLLVKSNHHVFEHLIHLLG
jgi:hypothetical protein